MKLPQGCCFEFYNRKQGVAVHIVNRGPGVLDVSAKTARRGFVTTIKFRKAKGKKS